MNGRLYDPLLRRFLNADENIQDPYNTQNYNKYGYVMNNPLMFNDPSGEFWQFLAIPIVKAVLFAVVSYTATVLITGAKFNILNLYSTIVMSMISAGITTVIGDVFSTATASIGNEALKSLVHAGVQGTLSFMQGGNFLTTAASAFLASAVSFGYGQAVGDAYSGVGQVAFSMLSGGVGSALTGGNFWEGVKIGAIVAIFNHMMHQISKPKYVVAGIYGAGGHEASGNPDLEALVESQGGRMFTSSVGGGDDDIIDYLVNGRNEGKQIKIYGHSRGGAAAVRIANKLGDMNIHVAEVNLYDPVGMYFGGDFVFKHPNVMKVNNYYQRNPTDNLKFAMKFEFADNPFIGSPVSGKFQWPVINNVNLTGKYYRPGVLINHLNITDYAIKHP